MATGFRLQGKAATRASAQRLAAAGRRLMFDTGAPDRARTVKGAAPLTVTLGNASAVSVQVDDQPIVVPRRAGKDAAKFVIGVDGAVR